MNFIVQLFQLFFQLLETLLKGLFELVEGIVSAVPKKNKGYKAEFASPSTLLSKNHSGFCLTGDMNLSVKDSYMNCFVVGGTGTGKSSVVLLPSIYTMKGSFVINDPSGELFSKSAGYLQSKGYVVKTLNFANPENSCGYNPLSRANNSSDIQKISAMLIENSVGKGNKDPFWTKMGEGLLTLMLSVLKKQEAQYQNLFNLRYLLNNLGAYPKKIDKLFSKKNIDPLLFAEYKSFLSYEEKTVSGIVASAKASLMLFSDETVAQVTSFDTLDLSDFRKRKVALFIQNSVADQRYYSVLTSIFFEQFFNYIMSRIPGENEQDIFLLIDEASSLKLPTLPLAVANIRKHKGGIMLVVQDYNQLVHCYDKHEAEGIRSNCFAKIYFTGQGLETAKELEQTLGKFEYMEKDNLHTGQAGKKVVRPLMTNDEIRTMKMNRVLLICGHHSPVMAKTKPYYQNGRMKNYSSIPAPVLKSEAPFSEIPVLPLEEAPAQ